MGGVKHVLIVGASRGLGFELVRAAVSASTRVIAIARPPAPALQELRAKHAATLTVGFADVRSDDELRAVAEGLGDARFDAIVYNAAMSRSSGELESAVDPACLAHRLTPDERLRFPLSVDRAVLGRASSASSGRAGLARARTQSDCA
jgi:NAD(P)-dependent dehydrogenase (short-subunit alcohol dehydrogenase family)